VPTGEVIFVKIKEQVPLSHKPYCTYGAEEEGSATLRFA